MDQIALILVTSITPLPKISALEPYNDPLRDTPANFGYHRVTFEWSLEDAEGQHKEDHPTSSYGKTVFILPRLMNSINIHAYTPRGSEDFFYSQNDYCFTHLQACFLMRTTLFDRDLNSNFSSCSTSNLWQVLHRRFPPSDR